MGMYDFDLDPNAHYWELIVERDAAARFAGEGSTRPFAHADYLWGTTAIYIARFGGWLPASGPHLVGTIKQAHAERLNHLPDGDLGYYVQVPAEVMAVARQDMAALLHDLPITDATVIIGSPSADYQRLQVWQTIAY